MIFITGDLHRDMSRLSIERFPIQEFMTENDFLIVLGDFGFIWDGIQDDYYLNELNNKNFTTLFIDGNHECASKHTDVLTQEGFMSLETAYNKNLKIANYDINTKEIRFDFPYRKYKSYHKKAIHIKGKNTEQLVSLNHDVIVNGKKVKAKNLLGLELRENMFDLRGKSKVKGINLDLDYLAFLTWVIMDGTIVDNSKYNKNSRKCTIQFKLSKDRKIKDLKSLLKKLNIGYTFKPATMSKYNKLQPYYIRIYSDEARKVLSHLNKVKKVPTSWKEATREELDVILDVISRTDGVKMNERRVRWVSVDKDNVDILQEACLKNNLYFRYREAHNNSGFKKDCKVQYICNIYTEKLLNKFINVEEVEYNDYMYCYSMPLGSLITRLNGKVTFTGNCFPLLYKYPIESWKGGKIHKIRDKVFHLMRGQIFNIEGKDFFTFGGAMSIDKKYRVEGLSWWKEEIPTEEEMKRGLTRLALNGNKVDYILTHECSNIIFNELFKYIPLHKIYHKLRDYMDKIESIDFKHWYFGHYHTNQILDDKHTVMFEDIKKIK